MSEPIRISINPPPMDMGCECCGRHAKDCKPFGKAGDPLVGDFDGVLLLKNFRSINHTIQHNNINPPIINNIKFK